MSYSSPTQLCFPPVGGQTLRADCEGGALSSDFGALLLHLLYVSAQLLRWHALTGAVMVESRQLIAH